MTTCGSRNNHGPRRASAGAREREGGSSEGLNPGAGHSREFYDNYESADPAEYQEVGLRRSGSEPQAVVEASSSLPEGKHRTRPDRTADRVPNRVPKSANLTRSNLT